MGYISIQINKAKGSADTGASDHIERKTTPKNAGAFGYARGHGEGAGRRQA